VPLIGSGGLASLPRKRRRGSGARSRQDSMDVDSDTEVGGSSLDRLGSVGRGRSGSHGGGRGGGGAGNEFASPQELKRRRKGSSIDLFPSGTGSAEADLER